MTQKSYFNKIIQMIQPEKINPEESDPSFWRVQELDDEYLLEHLKSIKVNHDEEVKLS